MMGHVPRRSPYIPCGSTARAIAADIEQAVRGGQLDVGERIPSVRNLAAELRISPATVASAYRDLRQRGLLISQGPNGMRVSTRPTGIGRPVLRVPAGARDLANSNPDPKLLPPPDWGMPAELADARLYGPDTAYGPLLEHTGEEFVREGVDASGQLVVSGAMDGIERILAVHLHPGDRVLVEDPTYAELLDLLRALRLQAVAVPADDDGPDPDRLSAALPSVQCAVLTPRAQNPTGATFAADRARELRTALGAHPGLLVIENDHSARVAGSAYRTLSGATSRWAVVRSVSKILSPDLRLAVIAADPDTINHVEGRQLLGPGWVSHVLQKIAHRLWTHPEMDGLLARATSIYAQRRSALIAELADRDIPARGASGLNVYVEVPEESTIAQTLLGAGWAVRTGEGYRVDTRQPFLRITTASLTPETGAQFADDLKAALGRSRTTRARRPPTPTTPTAASAPAH